MFVVMVFLFLNCVKIGKVWFIIVKKLIKNGDIVVIFNMIGISVVRVFFKMLIVKVIMLVFIFKIWKVFVVLVLLLLCWWRLIW